MQVPSSAVALGLNPGLAMVACLIGNLLVTGPVCIVGWLGSKYSIPFPVIARAAYGMIGAYWAMASRLASRIIRGIFCVILYGVQASLGGNAVRCMLEAIWPSFAHWHMNSLPASADITAPDLLCFALFWLASFPLLFVPLSSLRWLFAVKIAIMPFFYVALFTWALTAGNGVGPLFSIPNKITSGWSIGYVFCSTILATIGGNATFAVNMADITRYAKNPRSSAIAQAFALPICITMIELLGTLMAATAQVVYGEVLWNPLTIVLLWNNRTAKFFAGFLFAFATIATNITGNSIPFAHDIMGIFPKYLNVRRGQIICAILGFAMNPWVIQARASRFFNFVGGYSIFLGPLVGIILCDYFIIRKAKPYNMLHLYKTNGLYWYWKGCNPRALTAWMVGVTPLLPGLIYNINSNIKMGKGILEFYTLGWLDGLVIAALTYYLLCLAFPFPTLTVDGSDVVVEAKDEESVRDASAEGKPADVVAAKEI
ncbi:hypothetical protein LTR10_013116 [Elasticomyces elasticus]|uniref:NCS1 nucleoside transporter n=1 Tax=Exophiala sideris TaxID=1016849 RepID=A0ABR0JAU4_9EURO|nr:hypothetical protein LTR10_013116 [Elasticomyces elasticus]KAK5030491.1 hypothetical protein LTS07_005275 [Exophiala sideris]KAK5038545.1 hypothetical protein LTR13_004292 [Exophiala sideris]KAK5060426.1 hypothetical protein LTR69_005743 [Exophiala sideris]KAK5183338.1 hypothetical protein LTR44_004339 [Eurotiomycetes sp. CCFEE 6388]